MSDAVKEFEASKQNFLKSISQAFLAPLDESLATLEKMQSSDQPCNQVGDCDHLKQQLDKLRRGMQNMVYLTAIKNKQFARNSETIQAVSGLETFALSFNDLAKKQGINYFIYIDPNFPKEVTLDVKYVFHVLTNLLDNAMIFTPKGGNVYIDIRSKRINTKAVELTFSITDTGPGIPKDKVKSLLKPFASHEAQGMGLGISSSFFLLKSMDSQLKIASEENKGSRFSFTMKAQAVETPSFDILPELNVGVLIDDRALFGHAKIMYQYFISMGVDVHTINDIKDEKIKENHVLFILISNFDKKKEDFFKKNFTKTRLIPVMKSDYVSKFEADFDTKMHKLVLPATPSKMFDLLSFVKDNLPKDSVVTNADDNKIMKKLAETKRDEPLRILVAEDNPINLKLVQVVLGRYDFIIESASNGEKAVEMCKKVHYDLILMDIDMPIMDGVTANKLIKEYQKSEGIPTTPVVALTSHDMIGERSEILAKGLDEHMAKPLNIARLEMMLERYLGYKSKK